MRFVGIDIASETHVVAMVGEDGGVLLKPLSFREEAAGYALLWEKLRWTEDLFPGSAPDNVLVPEAWTTTDEAVTFSARVVDAAEWLATRTTELPDGVGERPVGATSSRGVST